ncbi:unnamed protein product [Rotaria socialis]|uniref:VCBS repeat-containing protein n=1 Tax=Rotaria socialis TaxID=392032 RepID=A0A821C893_9BILA|nr:unnamed protein product [Rotaria socialis]CAF4603052.1 unnamed protein product [Rotaria socialis]
MTYKTQSGSFALAAADFNRDDTLDIATANYKANNTSIFFGNGDGTVIEKKIISTGTRSFPYAIACSDLNRDNILELIVPNSGTGNIGILLGYGKGKFWKQQTYSTGQGSSPQEISVGDFNGDSRLDFVTVDYNQNSIGVFLSTCS